MAVLDLRFCARTFSSCGKRGPLFIAVRGPLTIVAPLVAEHRLQTRRLSKWLTGPFAPWHVGSSQTRARTRVPCIGRQILNHCATREAPFLIFKKSAHMFFKYPFYFQSLLFALYMCSLGVSWPKDSPFSLWLMRPSHPTWNFVLFLCCLWLSWVLFVSAIPCTL